MSIESSRNNNSNKENTSLVAYRRNAHFGSTVQYTSSIVINLRQLQTNLQSQHQHEKEALNELNQRFRVFVDRVQSVEAQNAKYLAELAAYRRQSTGDSSIDLQWNERYMSSQSDLMALRTARLDCESDFEWCQLQIDIFKQLFDSEQQWKDKRLSMLDQELKQAATELSTLRSSYADLERAAVSQFDERQKIFGEYLSLTYELCSARKQRKKWDFSLEALRSYIAFYKSICSYATRSYDSVVVREDDSAQYWQLELTESIKKIRRDFEMYHSVINREMTAYYESKMEELDKEAGQLAVYQRMEIEELTTTQQTLQVDYEKVQYSLTYEREAYGKLELSYSNLETEFKSLDGRYADQIEAQAREMQSLQERIMEMAYDVNEIQRSKVTLEAEIIIYRYLLDNCTYRKGERVTVAPLKQITSSELSDKMLIERRKKRAVGIKECAINGAYISLLNHSSSKDVDISRWTLKQRIDSTSKIRYTIPNGVRIQSGKELRIYSKSTGKDTSPSGSALTALVAQQQQSLVNNDVLTWGMGTRVETVLYNQNGDEEASYLQSLELKKSNM